MKSARPKSKRSTASWRAPTGKPPVILRPVRLSDANLLVEHRISMWRDIGGRRPSDLEQHRAVYRKWFRVNFRAGVVWGWVAVVGGRTAGSGLVWLQPSQPRPGEPRAQSPYILSMYTHPDHRGRGVASKIVRRLVDSCRKKGFERVTLHASPQGRPVYRRLGFERTYEMRRWVRKPPPRRGT